MKLLDPRALRPDITKEDYIFHVAYGSNLDEKKLRSRTPDGRKPIEYRSKRPAIVRGYRLRFRLPAIPPSEPVMADLYKDPAESLHGVLYEFSRYDYESLCISEHCAVRAPSYKEDVVQAIPYDGSSPVPATVFVRCPPNRTLEAATENSSLACVPDKYEKYLHPSERYLNTIRTGARAAGLHPEYIQWLDSLPAARPVSSTVNRRLSELALYGLFSLLGQDVLWRGLAWLKTCFMPVTVNLYVRREQAAACKQHYRETFWNVLMMTMYLPLVVVGIFSLLRRTTRIIFRE